MQEHEARSRTRGDRLGVTDTPVCERFHGQRLWSPYSGKVSQQLSSNHPIDMRLANSRQIYQWKEPLDLTNMSGRAEFTQRLYNLAKTFEADDENPFNGHSFAQGLAAYVNTDEFDSTLYSRKTKERKTDTGTSPEGDAGPVGSDFTVQGYELISDVIKNVKDTFEPLYKV